MNNNQRVLAYCQAKKLTNEELIEISGGAAKMSVEHTQKGSGSYPGTTDVEFDQIWD
ncbi:MAG: hypothetical protein H0U73_02035 [Tatlockia sp.]|nr:hypothetical protein [Tatlockia sp.]